MNLMNGDILLWKVNNFSKWYRKILAKGIQLFEGTYYHHAMVACDGQLYEADTVVKKVDLKKYAGSEYLHLRLKDRLLSFEESKYCKIIKDRVGAKYDYYGVILIQPIYILSGRKLWLGKTGDDASEKPYCTEFSVEAINSVRGYFPRKHLTGPYHLINDAPLYYNVVKEGKYL